MLMTIHQSCKWFRNRIQILESELEFVGIWIFWNWSWNRNHMMLESESESESSFLGNTGIGIRIGISRCGIIIGIGISGPGHNSAIHVVVTKTYMLLHIHLFIAQINHFSNLIKYLRLSASPCTVFSLSISNLWYFSTCYSLRLVKHMAEKQVFII